MYHAMILFKTNGPVKIHIQWTITKSVYSRLQLWLVLRTVVVTSACLIPSFHCPSSHWISPRMLWNIKEKRVRFTTENWVLSLMVIIYIVLFNEPASFIKTSLYKDLITEIYLFWHIDNIIGTHGGKRRDLWGMGLNFWWHCTPILQHPGCGYTINVHELSFLQSVYFSWYIRLLIKKLILSGEQASMFYWFFTFCETTTFKWTEVILQADF